MYGVAKLQEGICPGWQNYRRGYVGGGKTTGGDMSGVAKLQGGDVSGVGKLREGIFQGGDLSVHHLTHKILNLSCTFTFLLNVCYSSIDMVIYKSKQAVRNSLYHNF